MIPGTGTRVLALLGDPVRHSLSPRMHNAGFRAAGLDAIYVALACSESDLPGVMRTLAATGGGGNITVPHKAAAAGAGTGDARVSRLGVANVFSSRDGGLVLGNTDVDGMLALVDRLGGPEGPWCVVGTGGSARAVAAAAAERGARLAIRSRSTERRDAFRSWAADLGVEPADPAECTLLVNATPIGLGDDDPCPVSLAEFPGLLAVADLTYRRSGTTALVQAAREQGVAAEDGLEMLLVQGMAGWRHWFDGIDPPGEVMRAALREAMG